MLGITLLSLLLLPLLMLSACGGGDGASPTAGPSVSPAASAEVSPTASAEASPTPSSAAVELPEGFPEDFPIYEKATTTAARRIDAAQGSIYAIGMETTDSADTVQSFYEAKLAEVPWEVTNVVEIAQEDTVVVEFARQGGVQAGTVAIQEQQTDGRKTLITVSLPAPPATPTPSPAS